MTRNTAIRKIRKELDANGVSVNKIKSQGFTAGEEGCVIMKLTISLNCPNDDDVARILRVRENLLMNDGISIVTVLIEL